MFVHGTSFVSHFADNFLSHKSADEMYVIGGDFNAGRDYIYRLQSESIIDGDLNPSIY